MKKEVTDLAEGPAPQNMEFDQPQEPGGGKHANALVVMHSLLRGRYWLAILLAIVGLAAGAPLGYIATKPKFQCLGQIRIRSFVQKIAFDTPDGGMMPAFDPYMQAQIALIRSTRLIAEARNDPRWKSLGFGDSPEAVDDFLSKLDVTYHGELISVEFIDHDPRASYAAVTSVIDTFERNFDEEDNQKLSTRMQVLEERKGDLEGQLQKLTQARLDIGREYGATSLSRLHDLQLEERQKLKTDLDMAQVALNSAKLQVGAGGNAPAVPLAMPDDEMQLLLRREQDARLGLQNMLMTFGPNHPEVAKQQAVIDEIHRTITTGLSGPAGNAAGNNMIAEVRLKQAEARVATIRDMYNAVSEEERKLGARDVQMEELRIQADDIHGKLDEANKMLDAARLEQHAGGRFSVIDPGQMPHAPYHDKRKILAGAGAVGLALFGVGLVMLWGLFDGRLRQIADAKSRLPNVARLLGVLPSLPDNMGDPEQSAIAAHCVHQIRTLLQIQQGTSGHRVLAVTSPSPGDGKTSLAIALGLSYAATGAKTLLVDCDMYGRRLTARMTSSGVRKLGQILVYNRRINDDQLKLALERANCSGKRLGETLVEMRAVTVADIDHALTIQSRMNAGLCGVVRGDVLGDCVLRTGVPNLHLLPLGTDDPRQAVTISPTAVRPILDEAARQFDVVLIDTGPILGSLEAAVIASEADGVVLTISRGGQRTLVQNAVNYLASMNAYLEGVVFNRARPDDIIRSGYSSSVSTAPTTNELEAMAASGGNIRHWPKRLGPIAHALSAESASHTSDTDK